MYICLEDSMIRKYFKSDVCHTVQHVIYPLLVNVYIVQLFFNIILEGVGPQFLIPLGINCFIIENCKYKKKIWDFCLATYEN